MRPIIITKALTAASGTAVCASQTPAGAGDLTINGGLASGGVATLDSQRRVTITSAGNDSGNTFTLYGTNDEGNPISEAITGPNTTTVTSVMSYKTVTRVVISGAAVGAITVGSSALGATRVVPFDGYIAPFEALVGVEVTGTVNYTVQYTYDDVFAAAALTATGLNWVNTSLAAQTTTQDTKLVSPVSGVRLVINSGTGSVTFVVRQSGLVGG